MAKHGEMQRRIKERTKAVPRGGSKDLVIAIGRYKAKEKSQGRRYTSSEDRRITSAITDTLRRQAKAKRG